MGLVLDATTHPSGGPNFVSLDGQIVQIQNTLVTSPFNSSGAIGKIFAIFLVDAHGSTNTNVPVPFTLFWSDASGNDIGTPSGAGTWNSLESTQWNAPYTDVGQGACYIAAVTGTLTGVRIGIRRRTASLNNQDRFGGTLSYWLYNSNSGKVVQAGAHASLMNVQDNPPQSPLPIRIILPVQQSGSHIIFAGFSDNSNVALSGDTGRSAEAGISAVHGTKRELHFEDTGSDAHFIGRLATSDTGTILATTGSGNVTVGASTSDNYITAIAVEVQEASTSMGGGIAGIADIHGNLLTSINLSGAISGTGNVQGSFGGLVSPVSAIVSVGGTQSFACSPIPIWAVVEAGGGSIVAGSGGAATYTAPATPGVYHVTATVGGAVSTIVVIVVAVPARPTVRFDDPRQVMDGFGDAQGNWEPTVISDAHADLLYHPRLGIGLSYLRFGINHDGLIPRVDPDSFAATPWDPWGHIQKALLRNSSIRLITSVWSPLPAYKTNNSLVGGSLDPAHYADWAGLMAGFVTIAQSQTPPVSIYAVGVQNEPNQDTPFPSCFYTPVQIRNFIKTLKAAFSSLSSSIRPKLMAPEPSDPTVFESYLAAIEADNDALAATDIVATHQYGHAVMPKATRAARPIYQTEMSGLSGGPEAVWDPTIVNGIAVAKWIHSSIVDGNVTAWLYWWGTIEGGTGSPPVLLDNEALIVAGSNGTNDPNPSLTKRLYTLGNYSRWIRPGYQRYNIIGSLPANVSVTAYRDPVSSRMVFVCINEGGSPAILNLDLVGSLSVPSQFTPFVTSGTAIGSIGSAGNLGAESPAVVSGNTLSAVLGANTVTTLVSSDATLVGSVVGSASVHGDLATAILLRGDVSGQSSAAGNLATQIRLQGEVHGSASVQGGLGAQVEFSGSTAGQSQVSGDLTSQRTQFSGSSAGSSNIYGDLATQISLSGGIGGHSSIEGDLTGVLQTVVPPSCELTLTKNPTAALTFKSN